jgi:hypothetical protein
VHRTNRLIKLGACLVLLAATTGSSAVAAAQTPGAVLTKAEYQELTALQRGTKAALSSNQGSLRAALPVCRRALGVSALVRASKARCVALVYFGIGDENVVSAARRCEKVKTTDEALACLTPSFSAFSGDSETLLLSARRVARDATVRKFKTTCVSALGGSKQGLAILTQFAGDVRVVVASMKARNLGLFGVAIKRVDRIESSLKSVKAPALPTCPHL